MHQTDLQAEITALQKQISLKTELFDFGMRNDQEFEKMKALHLEIKELNGRLKMLMEENAKLRMN